MYDNYEAEGDFPYDGVGDLWSTDLTPERMDEMADDLFAIDDSTNEQSGESRSKNLREQIEHLRATGGLNASNYNAEVNEMLRERAGTVRVEHVMAMVAVNALFSQADYQIQNNDPGEGYLDTATLQSKAEIASAEAQGAFDGGRDEILEVVEPIVRDGYDKPDWAHGVKLDQNTWRVLNECDEDNYLSEALGVAIEDRLVAANARSRAIKPTSIDMTRSVDGEREYSHEARRERLAPRRAMREPEHVGVSMAEFFAQHGRNLDGTRIETNKVPTPEPEQNDAPEQSTKDSSYTPEF